MTTQQMAVVLAELKDAFPYFRMEEGTLKTYAEHFAMVDQHEAKQAVKRWVASQTRFPTVAELLNAVDQVRAEQRKLPSATADDVPMNERVPLEEARAVVRQVLKSLRGDE